MGKKQQIDPSAAYILKRFKQVGSVVKDQSEITSTYHVFLDERFIILMEVDTEAS